ncbi:hypothetical protein HYPSUDRAFT_220871 [Hypholoma sublateritium FD-334 SS-4]|uniref:Cytochrome P450 n=1 Tax=Hypholoma sublateritium (strain FD-334 SS-4) TaxID=945553 RepID=A0A0D2NY57_HYPSF|nr:hypothetical protein HYPSUDRAFT_220871 [Hypholoma sublateritium FD-334 SS-4]
MQTHDIALIAVIITANWYIFKYVLYSSRKRLPPGPRALPIIGNAHQMPVKAPWTVFSEWNSTYGEIIYLNIIGQPVVVVNSSKIAKDLLDKRSSIYSDRPVSIMCGQLVGFGPAYAMQNYGEKFRKQRRMVSQGFSVAKVPQYHGLQEKEGAILINNLLKSPGSLFSEVQLRVGVVILRIIYGYSAKLATDKLLTNAMEMMEIFNKTAQPGNFLVDVIPSLKYLPRWMPGSGFLDLADAWRANVSNTARTAYNWCKDNMESGEAEVPNLLGNIMQEAGHEPSLEERENFTWAAVGTLGGGLDTSSSATLSFMMAMIMYPEVQKKAQAELDAVIGTERLPRISDRAHLPYTRSVVAELLRWASIGPLGLPHTLREDDVYEGYHLSKGTIVIANIWHMLHDPEIYDSPMEFIPERFNGDDAEMAKVSDLVFGFGRRLCPGKNFAEGTLFANISTALATCRMLPGKNEKGEVVLPNNAYTTGITSFPEPYTINLLPRSAQAAALLAEASVTAE